MAKFGNSFLNHAILSEDTIEKYMWSPNTLPGGKKIYQGVGFKIYSKGNQARYFC